MTVSASPRASARVAPKDARAPRYVQRAIQAPDGTEHRVTVHLGESPVAWLHARGHLSERLALAGEKLREDWERAGLGARVTMGWGGVPGGQGAPGGLAPTERGLAAKRRLHAALDAAGPGLRDILWRVACAGEGLSAAERALGWPARAGKLVLTFALERVADHYRMP